MSLPQIEVSDLDSNSIPAVALARADDSLILVPERFADSDSSGPVYASTTESTLKLLRAAKVPVELSDGTLENLTVRDLRSLEWVAPTIFVSQLLFTSHPDYVALALDTIADYVRELSRGQKAEPTVKLKIVYRTSKKHQTREIKYKGPAAGLKDLPKTIAELEKNE